MNGFVNKNIYDIEISELLVNTNMPFCSRIGKLINEKNLKVERYRIVATSLIDLESSYNKLQNELLEYKKRFGDLE